MRALGDGPGAPDRFSPGDVVAVVDHLLRGDQGEIGDSPPTTIAATVVGVRVNDENGQNVVSVLVPEGDAAEP